MSTLGVAAVGALVGGLAVGLPVLWLLDRAARRAEDAQVESTFARVLVPARAHQAQHRAPGEPSWWARLREWLSPRDQAAEQVVEGDAAAETPRIPGKSAAS